MIPPRFPVFKTTDLQTAFQMVTQALTNAISKNEGTERVMLRSPNGTIYSITTDDSGVLTTTAVSGKTREI